MLKSYKELREIDVTPYCDKRDGMLYLNWAKCVDLLHENGAESVYFKPCTDVNGSSLIASEYVFTDSKGNANRCYETKIEIHIDDKVYFMQSPVMNGANPVKDNSMSQQRVWNSVCRSFVKGVAIYTGLGFDLWLKEEKQVEKEMKAEPIHHDIMQVRERVFEICTGLLKKGLSQAEIAEKLQITEDELKAYLSYYSTLQRLEHNLELILYDKL